MDANVEKTKRLLEDGFKIIRIEEQYENKKEASTLKQTITFRKDKENILVESINSEEFFKFIIHYKQVRDRYDNSEFVYIEDLDRYNRLIQNQHNKELLQDHHKIKISGREFSEGVMTLRLETIGGKSQTKIAEIWIDLDKNPNFTNVDFKDEILIYDRSNQILLKGFVKNYEASEKTGFISIQDLSLKMQHEKITAEFINMNNIDSLGLLTESAGFSFVPEGVPYNKNERKFIIIMPIQNLIIDESFTIGDVTFYQQFNNIDDSLIRKSKTGRTNPLWNGNLPRAKIEVKARQYFEALMKGYNAIYTAIDIISLRSDLAFPTTEINGVPKNLSFSYYKHLSKVKGTTLLYCRQSETQAHTFFNIESVVENVLSLDLYPQQYFREIDKICGDLINVYDLSKEKENILQVLHWLRKSLQEGNNKDKFLNLWVAFEFLTSGTSIPKLFAKEEISSLIQMIDDSSYNKEQKDAIKSKIQQLNDPPLMVIFNSLMTTLGVNLTNWELKILSTARKKRVDIIHGKKDVEIKVEELNKMRTIIEKMLIKKMQYLIS